MREQFVPYEIALKLKEKGFDEPCLLQEGYIFSYFGESKYRFHSQLTGGPFGTDLKGKKNSDLKGELPKYKDWVLIPLWQQVIDWFRTKHNIDISVFAGVSHVEATPIHWWTWVTRIEDLLNSDVNENFQIQKATFEEARQTGIEHALTLI